MSGDLIADHIAPEMVPTICGGCHGPEGVSETPAIPTISGQPRDYFIYTMRAYASEVWPSYVMGTIDKAYAYEDIEVMADFYAQRPYIGQKQDVDSAKAREGEKIHMQLCDKCHTEGGRAPDEYEPILAGQWMPYLRAAFKQYLAGERPQVPMMAKKMSMLSPEDADALIHYYGSMAVERAP